MRIANLRALPRSTQLLLWVIGGIALAVIPHISQVPLWTVLLAGIAALWRLAMDINQWSLPPRWARTIIAFASMLGVLATFRTLNGLEAGTSFLVVMGGVKLLETRSERDLTVLVFVAYFLLFAAFLYNQELLRLPYMLIAAWLLTVTLLRVHHTTRISTREAAALTGKMLLQAIPVAVLLFLFFPRLPGQFWAMPASSKASSGLSDEMSPGDVSELSLSSAIAFRVRFDGELPPPSERYWRGPVLNDFDGRTWRRSRSWYPDQPLEATGQTYRYRLTLEPHNRIWVFALDAVTQWPKRTLRTFDYQLITPMDPVSTLSSYDLNSATHYSVKGDLPLSMRRATLQLSPSANPRTRALAEELKARYGTGEAFVAAVLTKFREEEYFYTLEPPRLERDSVDDFLFNTRRGFCEHFASAFTAIARAAGIPARVVTGYQGGEFNPMGSYLIVRQSDAHAWSEVWLEGRGWVRVDPTAAVAPERIEGGLDAAMDESEPVPGRLLRRSGVLMDIRLAWDAMNTFWNNQIVEYGERQQRSFLEQLGVEDMDWQTLGIALVITFAAFFVVLSVYLGWRFSPHRKDPLVQVYEQLCRKLAKQVPREPHEGPNDYLGRVTRVRPDLKSHLAETRALYVALRYGPSALSSQLSRLKFLVNQLKV
jgi:transglutaminase-like putative cysteine protease